MKTFLSIGSGPGIGIATAERFAREGYRAVLTSRDPAGLAERASHLSARGHTVETRSIDAGNLADIKVLVRDVKARFGSVDVLHFNAASMRAATIEQQAVDTFVPDLTVNIGAALVAVQQASHGMLARGAGSVLLTGGGLATSPHPEYLSLSIGRPVCARWRRRCSPRFAIEASISLRSRWRRWSRPGRRKPWESRMPSGAFTTHLSTHGPRKSSSRADAARRSTAGAMHKHDHR